MMNIINKIKEFFSRVNQELLVIRDLGLGGKD